MEFRQLGGSGFRVPAFSLGTGTFGGGNEFFKARARPMSPRPAGWWISASRPG